MLLHDPHAGVTLVAYSPLTQGLLTGKYRPGGAKPFGPRSALFSDSRLREIQPLLAALKAVADERGKTMAQARAAYG
jgi:pyridoxine 4-dehydrogenase